MNFHILEGSFPGYTLQQFETCYAKGRRLSGLFDVLHRILSRHVQMGPEPHQAFMFIVVLMKRGMIERGCERTTFLRQMLVELLEKEPEGFRTLFLQYLADLVKVAQGQLQVPPNMQWPQLDTPVDDASTWIAIRCIAESLEMICSNEVAFIPQA